MRFVNAKDYKSSWRQRVEKYLIPSPDLKRQLVTKFCMSDTADIA